MEQTIAGPQKEEPTSRWEREKMVLFEPYRINLPMLLLTLILFTFGLIVLFSASMSVTYAEDIEPFYYAFRQMSLSLAGVLISVLIIVFWPFGFNRIAVVAGVYGVTLTLLILTARFGEVEGNARRWIRIAGVKFQASEIAKVTLVFFIAGYRSFIVSCRKKGKLRYKTKKMQDRMDAFWDIILPGIAVVAVLVPVLIQPHMSGFIILGTISLICFFVSGIKLKSWIQGGLVLLILGLLSANILMFVSDNEQKDKFLGNFDHVNARFSIFQTMNQEDISEKEKDPQNDADVYQSEQAMIAIGSGGLAGVGFGNSRQKFRYLPAAHTDYVFAIACEEMGFIGGFAIILLFWLFMCCGLFITLRTQGEFPRILALGYTTLITVQAFLSIGVSTGVIPPTGITMPFFSYGGTANLFFMVAVGLILAVSRTGTKRKKRFYI